MNPYSKLLHFRRPALIRPRRLDFSCSVNNAYEARTAHNVLALLVGVIAQMPSGTAPRTSAE